MSDVVSLNPTLFREYDIRGVVGESHITPEFARLVGQAYGTRVRLADGETICVARDGRLSSPSLISPLVEGLRATGLHVFDAGLGPTPYAHFASRMLGAHAMIMVTGSHNPGDQNGFKMSLHHKPFWGEDVLELHTRITKGDFIHGAGSYEEAPCHGAYVDFLIDDFMAHYPKARELRIAWDPGNGASGEIVEALVARLPGTHFVINSPIDGHFPAHHPDPTVAKNLTQLQELVAKESCDLGFAFDGDGDRIGAVDATGKILWGDDMMELYAAEVLKEHPGAPIIADVKASQALFDTIARLGGEPIMWKTGHSLIKSKMQESGALLAGELSGHIFFADRYFGYDDALYAALRLLGICATTKRTLAHWNATRPPRFATPELRFACQELNRFDVVARIAQEVRAKGLDMSDLDGVRVKSEQGWWLLRASNTQDVLVARAEGRTAAQLQALTDELAGFLKEEGLSLDASA